MYPLKTKMSSSQPITISCHFVLEFFPRLTLIPFFPALASGLEFSHPYMAPVFCFSALLTVPVRCFPVPVIGYELWLVYFLTCGWRDWSVSIYNSCYKTTEANQVANLSKIFTFLERKDLQPTQLQDNSRKKRSTCASRARILSTDRCVICATSQRACSAIQSSTSTAPAQNQTNQIQE